MQRSRSSKSGNTRGKLRIALIFHLIGGRKMFNIQQKKWFPRTHTRYGTILPNFTRVSTLSIHCYINAPVSTIPIPAHRHETLYTVLKAPVYNAAPKKKSKCRNNRSKFGHYFTKSCMIINQTHSYILTRNSGTSCYGPYRWPLDSPPICFAYKVHARKNLNWAIDSHHTPPFTFIYAGGKCLFPLSVILKA